MEGYERQIVPGSSEDDPDSDPVATHATYIRCDVLLVILIETRIESRIP